MRTVRLADQGTSWSGPTLNGSLRVRVAQCLPLRIALPKICPRPKPLVSSSFSRGRALFSSTCHPMDIDRIRTRANEFYAGHSVTPPMISAHLRMICTRLVTAQNSPRWKMLTGGQTSRTCPPKRTCSGWSCSASSRHSSGIWRRASSGARCPKSHGLSWIEGCQERGVAPGHPRSRGSSRWEELT